MWEGSPTTVDRAGLRVVVCADYYGTSGARRACHAVKGEFGAAAMDAAMRSMSEALAEALPLGRHSLLIPAPQHGGRATYMLEVARRVADLTGARILDVVRCAPHAPLYAQKRATIRSPRPSELDFEPFLAGGVPRHGDPWVLDNVLATGETLRRVSALLPSRARYAAFACDSAGSSRADMAGASRGRCARC